LPSPTGKLQAPDKSISAGPTRNTLAPISTGRLPTKRLREAATEVAGSGKQPSKTTSTVTQSPIKRPARSNAKAAQAQTERAPGSETSSAEGAKPGRKRKPRPPRLPAKFNEGYVAKEGGVLVRTLKVRERDRKIIEYKKSKFRDEYGHLFCEACKETEEACIEVHHTHAVSAMKSGDLTTFDALVLLCANCHRIAHLGGKCRSVAQVRKYRREAT
jgi:HNH endonuclease